MSSPIEATWPVIDAPDVLHRSLDLYETLFDRTETPRGDIEDDVRSGRCELAALVDREGQVTSFCLFHGETGKALDVRYLGVSPAFQGRGLGTMTIRLVAQYCRQTHPGLFFIALICSLEKMGFYQRIGFRHVGVEYDENGVQWQKMVSDIRSLCIVDIPADNVIKMVYEQ